MLNDTQRMRGFKAAIDHVVWAGAEVLDLGPDTGVLSFFAAARGADVRCVERNPELVATARRMLSLNGHADRVDHRFPADVTNPFLHDLRVAHLEPRLPSGLDVGQPGLDLLLSGHLEMCAQLFVVLAFRCAPGEQCPTRAGQPA